MNRMCRFLSSVLGSKKPLFNKKITRGYSDAELTIINFLKDKARTDIAKFENVPAFWQVSTNKFTFIHNGVYYVISADGIRIGDSVIRYGALYRILLNNHRAETDARNKSSLERIAGELK